MINIKYLFLVISFNHTIYKLFYKLINKQKHLVISIMNLIKCHHATINKKIKHNFVFIIHQTLQLKVEEM
jgi:hypothetical protein